MILLTSGVVCEDRRIRSTLLIKTLEYGSHFVYFLAYLLDLLYQYDRNAAKHNILLL